MKGSNQFLAVELAVKNHTQKFSHSKGQRYSFIMNLSRGKPLSNQTKRSVKAMFASLFFRDFRLIWLSSIAGLFAMNMQIMARGWLIYDITNSAMDLTWVMLSFMAPSLFFSLLGGVIADRLRKKQTIIASGLLNTLATFVFAWIVYQGEIQFEHFIYFGLFNGTVLALSMPARMSAAPEIVGKEHIVNATALQSATFNLSRIAGPALAGLVIRIASGGDTSSHEGVGIVFFTVAGLYAISVVTTMLMKYQGSPHEKSQHPLKDMTEAFIFLRQEKLLVGLLILGFVPMTFGFSVTFLAPVFNQETLSGDATSLSYLLSAAGIGALVGSLLLARLGDLEQKGLLMFTTGYLWAISICLFTFAQTLEVALLLVAFTGLFGAIIGSLNMGITQMLLPDRIRGRVMSIMMMAHSFAPIGLIPISALSEKIGIESALFLAGCLVGGSLLIIQIWIPDLATIKESSIKRQSQSDRPSHP